MRKYGFSALVAAGLLLGLSCAPALASSGYSSLCEKLTIETVDLATSSTIDPAVRIETDSLEAAESRPAANPLTPKAETILRQIFDETPDADQETTEASAVTSPNAAPIVELAAPVRQEQTQSIESSDLGTTEVQTDSIDAEIPGVSDDDLLRYRRQMYRTDI